MQITKLLSELPTLNKQDLTLLRAACDRLIGVNAAPGPLWNILNSSSGGRANFSAFSKGRAYKPWVEHEAAIMLFMTKNWPDANKVTLNSLKHFLFKLLVDDLKRRGIRITIGVVALNAGSIPAIFEQQFPGYIRSGLGNVILMSLVTKNGRSSRRCF